MDNDILKGAQINSAGFGTIPKLAMQDRRLHITAKAIYAYFNSFAGGGDRCFPSRNKICFDLDISSETLTKYLRELVKWGYIKVEQVKENGKFSHNVYILCESILPCTEISDTENTVHGNLATNINNINNNNIINNNNNISKERSKFSIPTFEEVQAYCLERNNGIDAQHFIDHYNANGWKVGKVSMVDWKAAVRTWERRRKDYGEQKQEPHHDESKTSYDLTDWEMKALKRRIFED